jgi:hypothetical protein
VRAVTARLALAAGVAVTAFATHAAADTVVQLNVDAVIDGRSVSTVVNDVVTPWSAGDGLDGADGFVTTAVEAILQTQGKTEGGKVGPALPDDGLFPADAAGRHPAIQLHFSNAAPTTSPQTHQVPASTGPQTFTFAVPEATYSKMFLVLTSSYGVGDLTVTLSYAGGVAPTVMMIQLPDWGVGGAAANDPVFFNLIQGLHKWTATDQEVDTPTHGITGIELTPTPAATLTSVRVAKTNSAQVVFWGATGIATSVVTTGHDGGADASDASAVDTTAAADADATASDGASGTGAGGVADAGGPLGSGVAGTPETDAGAAGAAGMNAATGSSGASGSSSNVSHSSGSGCSLSPKASANDTSSVLFAVLALALRWKRRPVKAWRAARRIWHRTSDQNCHQTWHQTWLGGRGFDPSRPWCRSSQRSRR